MGSLAESGERSIQSVIGPCSGVQASVACQQLESREEKGRQRLGDNPETDSSSFQLLFFPRLRSYHVNIWPHFSHKLSFSPDLNSTLPFQTAFLSLLVLIFLLANTTAVQHFYLDCYPRNPFSCPSLIFTFGLLFSHLPLHNFTVRKSPCYLQLYLFRPLCRISKPNSRCVSQHLPFLRCHFSQLRKSNLLSTR